MNSNSNPASFVKQHVLVAKNRSNACSKLCSFGSICWWGGRGATASESSEYNSLIGICCDEELKVVSDDKEEQPNLSRRRREPWLCKVSDDNVLGDSIAL